MRIIAGRAGGRRLRAPSGTQTRPTADRVRESLFSMLADTVEGANVLDLFAGSGSLGLEALSRGARHVTFVEKARPALETLRANASIFSTDTWQILPLPAERAVPKLTRAGAVFDLVFLDPPYDSELAAWALEELEGGALLCPGATVVVEHRGRRPPPTGSASLELARTRKFGDVAVTFYELRKGQRP